MDQLGDWVYIILMVVVGVSSLFGSINKKKREQQTQMPLPEPAEPSYSEFPPVPKKKEKKAPLVSKQIEHQPFNAHLTFPVDETDSQVEMFLVQEEESALIGELELTDPDAFRKAVIYSEIINRKY
jgi:hypothetical protein